MVPAIGETDKVSETSAVIEKAPSAAKRMGQVHQLGKIETVQDTGAVWRIPIVTNGTTVSFKVDTGAQVSILPRETYNRLHQKPKLTPSDSRILTFGARESLPVDGKCICQVMLDNGLARHLRFLVVPFEEEPLLGLGACRHLGLINLVRPVQETRDNPASSEAVLEGAGIFDHNVEKDPVASQYREIFGGIGCLKLNPYTIHLQEDARPYAVVTSVVFRCSTMTK